MNTYIVTPKGSEEEVCRYMADSALDLHLFPLASFDHTELAAEPPPAPVIERKEWISTDFQKRFTDDERAAIRAEARANVRVEDLLAILISTPIVVNIDPLTQRGMAALAAMGLITEERKNEILYG